MVAGQITNVTMTCADKYSQDSYGYTSLSYPIPLFADFERLVKLDPASLEYGLIKTQLVKNKNRINDCIVYHQPVCNTLHEDIQEIKYF